jgi:hypothetical protein
MLNQPKWGQRAERSEKTGVWVRWPERCEQRGSVWGQAPRKEGSEMLEEVQSR